MEIPQPFLNRMKQMLDTEYNDFLDSLKEEPNVSVRINPYKWKDKIGNGNKVKWSEYGYYLPHRPIFTLDPYFHSGFYYPQESSSMFLEYAFKYLGLNEKDIHILDMCAAPGGKSISILSCMSNDSLLLSNEVNSKRAEVLKENLIKFGDDRVIITNSDANKYANQEVKFDVVILDAPCSGEGMFRKDPRAIEEWKEDTPEKCSIVQQRLIESALEALNEDGILFYSTCTFSECENEDIINHLTTNFEAELVDINIDKFPEICRSNNNPTYRFYPHRVPGEGFFFAAIRKKSINKAVKSNNAFEKFIYKAKFTLDFNKIIAKPLSTFSLNHKDVILFDRNHSQFLHKIHKFAKIIHLGIPFLAKNNNLELPLHPFSLFYHLKNAAYPSYQLDYQGALKYLAKETIMIDGKKGYSILKFEDANLGFAKILDDRINNLYPTNWRIRMNLIENRQNLIINFLR